jgi:N-acetylglucosamine malate deacetylase 1
MLTISQVKADPIMPLQPFPPKPAGVTYPSINESCWKAMRVIGFGAHPDDVEIFFIGLLLSCQANGHEIGWVVATDGQLGVEPGFDRLTQTELGAMRRQEAITAANLIGVQPVLLGMQDGSLNSDTSLVSRLAEQISALSPDLAVTHAPNDYHADHRALSLALSIASSARVPILFADTMRGIGFEPACCVDITSQFPQKRDAILSHLSQLPERFVHLAETMNAFRALQCKLQAGNFAEAYRLGDGFALRDFESMLPAGRVRPPAARMS